MKRRDVDTKARKVTKKDVMDAALIAQLIGGADIARAEFACVEHPPRKLHDCPDCEHVEYGAECEHGEEWECVAGAIGATLQALDLWMEISNAFFTTVKDRAAELRYLRTDGTMRELRGRAQLYDWVDSICKGGINHGSLGLNELEVAALLRDGHLPPGWRVVTRSRRPTLDPPGTRRIRDVGNRRVITLTGEHAT